MGDKCSTPVASIHEKPTYAVWAFLIPEIADQL